MRHLPHRPLGLQAAKAKEAATAEKKRGGGVKTKKKEK
jgi:hypothetical protein